MEAVVKLNGSDTGRARAEAVLQNFRELRRAELAEYVVKYPEAFGGELMKIAGEEVEDAIYYQDLVVFAEAAGVAADRMKAMFPYEVPSGDLHV